MQSVQEVLCNCGYAAAVRVTRGSGSEHFGWTYYVCDQEPKCKFWKWARLFFSLLYVSQNEKRNTILPSSPSQQEDFTSPTRGGQVSPIRGGTLGFFLFYFLGFRSAHSSPIALPFGCATTPPPASQSSPRSSVSVPSDLNTRQVVIIGEQHNTIKSMVIFGFFFDCILVSKNHLAERQNFNNG